MSMADAELKSVVLFLSLSCFYFEEVLSSRMLTNARHEST